MSAQRDDELRDVFAAAALAGAMSGAHGLGDMDPAERSKLLKDVAEIVFEVADAMIAARGKP